MIRLKILACLNNSIAVTRRLTSHTAMTRPTITSESDATGVCIRIAGDLRTQSLDHVEEDFAALRPNGQDVVVDMAQVQSLDTGGAWLVANLVQRLGSSGAQVRLEGLDPAHSSLIETVSHNISEMTGDELPPRGFVNWVARIGEKTFGAWQDTLSIVGFLGLTLHRLVRTLIMPWRLRRAALVSQMEQVGFKALPIVSLMGFLIGVVLAFQGATQLKQFGAEIFVVELISISILRELGILLTAIIVAGRSGSAFTASIGSMKVQEEIDAMRTLGLDPIEVLVIPRVLALLIMLPILGFVADMAGLIGGALMSWIDLGVSPGMFLTRLKENTGVAQLAVGMIKAPFFALVIGVIACWQAMQVKGSSESVGQRTTASVVQSIFMVIAIDALFSIFFSELGV
ncbi:phospholipid/cholesterol/gamma-HCH transport system permease protein [Ruegeria halocynthiae]|uniref:Phospholipid/cholesterol/gamma-HCH transport system permease protein n=2 Tax=Ruegeria halocynthiae TaxID=985054 RepID=A0A1H3E2R3_9RHOB|nr:phospholipid/cholesterol/gamma-HCH transport system permease protein [Ruegeria halocynthiae]